MNGWGFRRLTEGLNRSSYFEENFLRDMPWLCKNMGRHKVGGKGELNAGKLFRYHRAVCLCLRNL